MLFFKDPTPLQQIQQSIKKAQTDLLTARTRAFFYANEVCYQEGLLKLLKEQLSDKDITINHATGVSSFTVTNPQQPPVRNPNPATAS